MGQGKIVVLGTGGTIAGTAGTAGDNIGYTAAQLGVAQLLDALPALRGLPLEAEQVAQLDSKDMDFVTWQRLAARCAHWLAQPDVQGLVITHGTDTLEETAWFLQCVLQPAKPVVLACAMRPATALAPDGPQNLLDAVAVARTPGAQGVVAVCAGRVHGAREVSKVHPYRVDAFDSGEAGPLAVVEEGAVRLLRGWPAASKANPALLAALARTGEARDAGGTATGAAASATETRGWPRVEIVMNHAGATGAIVEALAAQGVDGLVAAGTGNGTLAASLEEALAAAQAGGIRVLRASRCPLGRVLPHAGAPLPDSGGLSPVKARVSLLLQLLVERGG